MSSLNYTNANGSNFLNTYSTTYLNQLQQTQNNQSGVKLTGHKRIIDRFVKYPYPQNIITNYKKDFHPRTALYQPHKDEAFNLEKEHKIINPHQMDLNTTKKVDFKPFIVEPKR